MTLEEFKSYYKTYRKDQLLEQMYTMSKEKQALRTELDSQKASMLATAKNLSDKLQEQEKQLKKMDDFKKALAALMEDEMEEVASGICAGMLSDYDSDRRDSEWESRVGLEA